MRYSLVIFDLDGTLADSFPWFLRVVNGVADKFRFKPIEPDDVESLRRAGTREILKRLDVPFWKLPAIATAHARAQARAARAHPAVPRHGCDVAFACPAPA